MSTTCARLAASALGEAMSRLKMVEKVARLATLKTQSALIVMCTSSASRSRRNTPARQPRASRSCSTSITTLFSRPIVLERAIWTPSRMFSFITRRTNSGWAFW
jgi:hypothetical protein